MRPITDQSLLTKLAELGACVAEARVVKVAGALPPMVELVVDDATTALRVGRLVVMAHDDATVSLALLPTELTDLRAAPVKVVEWNTTACLTDEPLRRLLDHVEGVVAPIRLQLTRLRDEAIAHEARERKYQDICTTRAIDAYLGDHVDLSLL